MIVVSLAVLSSAAFAETAGGQKPKFFIGSESEASPEARYEQYREGTAKKQEGTGRASPGLFNRSDSEEDGAPIFNMRGIMEGQGARYGMQHQNYCDSGSCGPSPYDMGTRKKIDPNDVIAKMMAEKDKAEEAAIDMRSTERRKKIMELQNALDADTDYYRQQAAENEAAAQATQRLSMKTGGGKGTGQERESSSSARSPVTYIYKKDEAKSKFVPPKVFISDR